MQLNTEKSKIICFKKRGRRRKIIWKWEGKELEEVAEVKYLGFVLKKNGGEESQTKELRKIDNVVMNVVWGIGEYRFRDDFRKRMMLFNYLVRGVMLYGAEIREWKVREELEKIQRKYIK